MNKIKILAGMILALATVGGLSACGSTPVTTSKPATSTFTLKGTITVPITRFDNSSNDTCSGHDGYSDITPGAAIVVADSTGKTIATGSLTEGMGIVPINGQCVMPFTVPNVPDGLTSYVVTISHRGSQVVNSTAAHSSVALSLGQN